MSVLSRVTQLLFGSTAGGNDVEQFGSLAAGSPNYTSNPATIQALSAWLQGWRGAVVGSNLPAIQDMNAAFLVAFYQLAYIFQEGIAEYDSATNYNQYSLVQSGGIVYQSVSANNLGNLVSNATFWTRFKQPTQSPTQTIYSTAQGPTTYTPPAGAQWLNIIVVGAGGGGSGSGGAGGTGSNGTSSSIGGTIIASGGTGGTQFSRVAGGAPTISGGGYRGYGVNGGQGNEPFIPATVTGATLTPGAGGATAYAPKGLGAANNNGQGGDGGAGGASQNPGSGGGGGGYCNVVTVGALAGTYTVFVGSGGAGGSAGSGGNAGEQAGDGIVIINEYYN